MPSILYSPPVLTALCWLPTWVVAVMVGAGLSGPATAEGRAWAVEGDAALEVTGEDGAEAEAGSQLSEFASSVCIGQRFLPVAEGGRGMTSERCHSATNPHSSHNRRFW